MSGVEPPSFEAPHTNGAPHVRPAAPRRVAWGPILVAITFALICAGIVFGWTFVGSKSPERLDDESAAAVEAACADARAQLRDLPNPSPTLGADRVERVRSENEILLEMVATLDAIEPADATPARALAAWRDDWRALVESRARYATELETEKRARLVLPASNGIEPVTERMDDFVDEQGGRANSCMREALNSDQVEGPRSYDDVEG
jgi:hypothetical protein